MFLSGNTATWRLGTEQSTECTMARSASKPSHLVDSCGKKKKRRFVRSILCYVAGYSSGYWSLESPRIQRNEHA